MSGSDAARPAGDACDRSSPGQAFPAEPSASQPLSSVPKLEGPNPISGRRHVGKDEWNPQFEVPLLDAWEGPLLAVLLLAAIFTISVLVTIEVFKDSVTPELGVWASRLVSIAATTLLACGIASYLYYERKRLIECWRSEISRRWHAESRLRALLNQRGKPDQN